MKGSTFRRCACRDPETGKQYGLSCPKLSQRRHGTWTVRQELPAREDGSRRTFRRSGYESAKAAQDDLDKIRALLAIPEADDDEGRLRIAELLEVTSKEKSPLPRLEDTRRKLHAGQSLTTHLTVGEWLDIWLATKKTRTTTTNGYRSHIEVHLKPRLGRIRLDKLTSGHVQAMFDMIVDDNEVVLAENMARREQAARSKPGRPGAPNTAERRRLAAERARLAEMRPFRRVTGAATRQRIRSTLRAALNLAVTRRLISYNPAAGGIELASGKRPKAVLWTPERVRRWEATGERPSPVMVWTPELLGRFLDKAEGDRLYALFHLVAFRGLRRGEAVGQDWADIDLEHGELTVTKTIVQDGWTPYESLPKTDGSAATIHLDSLTVAALRAHRLRQAQERQAWGEGWQETGNAFTTEDGGWLHPEKVSDAFRRIAMTAGLPPISFRDLRHLAATLMHASGADTHTIKETLRHASIQLTSDTYTSLLPELDREVAEKAALLVPRAAGKTISRTSGLTSGSPAFMKEGLFPLAKPATAKGAQVNRHMPVSGHGGAGGTRTHDRRIMSPLL